jgi:Cu-Zn family superoxide dismutase
MSSVVRASCIMRGEVGVSGLVTFEQSANGGPTTIKAKFNNLPKGQHGFHIHQFGDLSNGCVSAGAHFNPHGKTHGGPNDETRHVGDMGNIESTGAAETEFSLTDNLISLIGQHSVIGRSVVIHEKEDDLGRGGNEESLKTGNAGSRMACGVIGIAQ